LFLVSGCDLNAVDNYGDCALKKAAFSGHAEFIKTLLAAGANPDVCDGFMKSPLCACRGGRSLPPFSLSFSYYFRQLFRWRGLQGRLRTCALVLQRQRQHSNLRRPHRPPLRRSVRSASCGSTCFVWQHLLHRGVSLHAVFTSPMRLSHRLPFQYNPHPRVRRHRACSCACRCRPQHHGWSLRPHSTSSGVCCGPPLRLQVCSAAPPPAKWFAVVFARNCRVSAQTRVFQYVTEMQSSFSRSV
jgi:hypothetical protein